jgi:hypothetical protein
MCRELDAYTGAIHGMGRLEIRAVVRDLTELGPVCELLKSEARAFAQGFGGSLCIEIRVGPAVGEEKPAG